VKEREMFLIKISSLSKLLKNRPIAIYDNRLTLCKAEWEKKAIKKSESLLRGIKYEDEIKCPGLRRLYNIRKDFQGAIECWQMYQWDAMENMIHANINHILGTDLYQLERVARDSRWVGKPPNELLLQAARGSGKSTLLSAMAATFIKNIPNYNAMLYSGIQTKSVDLLNSVYASLYGMISKDPYCNVREIKKTKDIIRLVMDDNDCREIRAMSALGMVSCCQSLFFF